MLRSCELLVLLMCLGWCEVVTLPKHDAQHCFQWSALRLGPERKHTQLRQVFELGISLHLNRLRGGVARERQQNMSWDILSARARQRLKSAEEEDTPASDAVEACEERIATGGIGTISCANILLEGQPMGMLYEKKEDGEKYKTATLVVGHSMGPMSVLGKGRALSIKSSAAAAVESELTGKQRVYFEPNRHGKWRPVLAPKGMSTRQLLRKVEAEQTFMKSLTLVQRKQMALERERAILHAEAEGLHVVSIPSERGLIKKLKKRKKEIEKTRQRFEDKAKEMAEQKKARDIERERRLKDRRNGSKGVDGKTRMRVGGRSDKRRRVEGGPHCPFKRMCLICP